MVNSIEVHYVTEGGGNMRQAWHAGSLNANITLSSSGSRLYNTDRV